MEHIWDTIFALLLGGGSGAVIAILIGIILALIFVVKSVTSELKSTSEQVIETKDEDKKTILEIIEKYHQGNLTVVQALNEIRAVLMVIQAKI